MIRVAYSCLIQAHPGIRPHDLVSDTEEELLAFGVEADAGVEVLDLFLDPPHGGAHFVVELTHAMKRVEGDSDGRQ